MTERIYDSGGGAKLLQTANRYTLTSALATCIPVKITLDPGGPMVVVLRPGMSAYPTIHTRAEALRGASTPAHQV